MTSVEPGRLAALGAGGAGSHLRVTSCPEATAGLYGRRDQLPQIDSIPDGGVSRLPGAADLIATGQMLGMSPTIGNYAKSAAPCEGLEAVPP